MKLSETSSKRSKTSERQNQKETKTKIKNSHISNHIPIYGIIHFFSKQFVCALTLGFYACMSEFVYYLQ